MSGIANKIGRYLHADGMRRTMTFEGGRSFTVVVAGAYDAGIVGPEHNGIVVLDQDNAAVVLDQHVRESSGYHGPSRAQVAEFERVTAITDWKEFTAFLGSNPRYREGSVPDLKEASPTPPSETNLVLRALGAGGYPDVPGPSLLSEDMVEANANPDAPYSFPRTTRLDIVTELARHPVHSDGYRDSNFAWDVKVHRADMDGKVEGYPVSDAYDELWKAWCEHDENGNEIFQRACEDGLRVYLDGEATTWPGDDQGSYEFSTGGRSGGWLHLTAVDGVRLTFSDRSDMVAQLLDMEPSTLAKLYRATVCFDTDIQPEKDFAAGVAFQRQQKEEEWATDPDLAEKEAAEVGLEDWRHPDRAPVPA